LARGKRQRILSGATGLRTHGGSDDLLNLGLACARCNMQKGYRPDVRDRRDARAREVIETLLERRRRRWREPQGEP
jgi:hypothetical protein